ncbi:MAG: hypothetical protein AAF799_07495 [Myxococcota bacterium]
MTTSAWIAMTPKSAAAELHSAVGARSPRSHAASMATTPTCSSTETA